MKRSLWITWWSFTTDLVVSSPDFKAFREPAEVATRISWELGTVGNTCFGPQLLGTPPRESDAAEQFALSFREFEPAAWSGRDVQVWAQHVEVLPMEVLMEARKPPEIRAIQWKVWDDTRFNFGLCQSRPHPQTEDANFQWPRSSPWWLKIECQQWVNHECPEKNTWFHRVIRLHCFVLFGQTKKNILITTFSEHMFILESYSYHHMTRKNPSSKAGVIILPTQTRHY